MPDIQWDSQASLMRVTALATSDESQEDLVARGTLHELVGAFVELAPVQQKGLLLRAAGRDWTQEFDSDAIRELAARPEFTGAYGDYDTAERADDPDVQEVGG
jgi:hypothetical protein